MSTAPTDDYLAIVKDQNGALLVDVRDANEFKAGRVPGTVNVPRARLGTAGLEALGYPGKVDMNRKIYTQCDHR